MSGIPTRITSTRRGARGVVAVTVALGALAVAPQALPASPSAERLGAAERPLVVHQARALPSIFARLRQRVVPQITARRIASVAKRETKATYDWWSSEGVICSIEFRWARLCATARGVVTADNLSTVYVWASPATQRYYRAAIPVGEPVSILCATQGQQAFYYRDGLLKGTNVWYKLVLPRPDLATAYVASWLVPNPFLTRGSRAIPSC